MLLEADGSYKLDPQEFDQLLNRAERARDLLGGGAAVLRETDGNATAADLVATARNVVGAIVADLEGALAIAHERRRVHGQALKHVSLPSVQR